MPLLRKAGKMVGKAVSLAPPVKSRMARGGSMQYATRDLWRGALGSESRVGKMGAGMLIGGAAMAGGVAAVLDTKGPYPDIQRQAFGDPSAFRASIRGAAQDAFSNSYDVPGAASSYYGRPVSSGRHQPVSGSSVFGMYNLRR